MSNGADLAVHDAGGTHDGSAKDVANGLQTEAHTKNGNGGSKAGDHVAGNTSVFGPTRPGRQDDGARREAGDVIEGDGVITNDIDLRTEDANLLHDVVRKGIVIIDDENVHVPDTTARRRGVTSPHGKAWSWSSFTTW